MDRTAAVRRINDALGFRPDGNPLEAKIILRLAEAQKDLEHGKTLPKFLLQEDQTINLLAGATSIALPTGFLRIDEDNPPHFVNVDTLRTVFLKKATTYADAVRAIENVQRSDTVDVSAIAPSVFVIRRTTLDFVSRADVNYTLMWSYYKSGDSLETNNNNAWLDDDSGSLWLIGEAGYRVAMDIRDADAATLFDKMRTQGRAALFGDVLLDEDAGGPIIMGATL
jgi:hypothetical protein